MLHRILLSTDREEEEMPLAQKPPPKSFPAVLLLPPPPSLEQLRGKSQDQPQIDHCTTTFPIHGMDRTLGDIPAIEKWEGGMALPIFVCPTVADWECKFQLFYWMLSKHSACPEDQERYAHRSHPFLLKK